MLPIHSTLRLRSNLEVDTGDDESEHDLSAAVAKASEYLKEVGGFASKFDEKEFLQDTNNRTVIKNAFPHLKSGGYLEIQDGIVPWRGDDDSFRGSNFDKWQNLLCEGLSQTGRDLMDAKNWGRYMREEGFKDVVEQHFFMPINPWAKGQREKLIGLLCQRDWALALPDMSVPVFTKILGWTKEQYDKLMEGLLRDLENTDIHGYMEVYVAYGRKP
ncbi:hypothetical protein JX265_001335 [Neoarthrinium moseri]|uniref:Methyltransferase tdiE n=1 Tax=Neoarthrinium moseri TaxID=1658444 RepID=A0A9Q0AV32_9PEZI|nr:hypothetical protein JX265_001335 [Neoarthrinium moseri]